MESRQQSLHKYLILRSKEGDRRAQNELYKLYAGAMYNICRRMLGDEDDAKDLLQDAFVDAFAKLKYLKHEGTFSAWIKRIVINKCINALKKKRLNAFALEDDMDIPQDDDQDRIDDYQVAEVGKIMKAIDQISEGCRTVLNLYLFEGYDHKEISQILSISEAASKAQYSKAKSKIRKILEDENRALWKTN